MIQRDTLRSLLIRWQSGEITEREIHEEAEELYLQFWAERPTNAEIAHDDPASFLGEILAQLEMLNVGLIVTEDIPAMLAFLNTSQGEEAKSWLAWERYMQSIDFKEREGRIATNRYYITSPLPET